MCDLVESRGGIHAAVGILEINCTIVTVLLMKRRSAVIIVIARSRSSMYDLLRAATHLNHLRLRYQGTIPKTSIDKSPLLLSSLFISRDVTATLSFPYSHRQHPRICLQIVCNRAASAITKRALVVIKRAVTSGGRKITRRERNSALIINYRRY